jgi:hypothetical protein
VNIKQQQHRTNHAPRDLSANENIFAVFLSPGEDDVVFFELRSGILFELFLNSRITHGLRTHK